MRVPRPTSSTIGVLGIAIAAQALVSATGSEVLALVLVACALPPALTACLSAARRTQGAMRATWRIAAACMALWLVALATWAIVPAADVSLGDAPLLASTALAGVALLVWPAAGPRLRGPGSASLDAVLCAGALLYVSWPLLIHRFFDETGLVAAVGAGYVVLDIAIVTVVLLALAGRRRVDARAFNVAVAGVAALVVADVASSILRAVGSPSADVAITGVSILGALLVRRSAQSVATMATAAPRRPWWMPLLAPWLPLAAAFGVAVHMKLSDNITGEVRVLALSVLFLTMIRLAVTARENHRLNQRLAHRASHDALTGLASRSLRDERLAEAVTAATQTGTHVAVLMLDLDGFRTLNETRGHSAGDALLCDVAARLRAAVRPGDTAARLGGDEFFVVLPALGADRDAACAQAMASAEGLRAAVGARASVGVALGDGRGSIDGEELVADAELAMYAAKSAGGGRAAAFTDRLRTTAVERAQTEQELRDGIERGELRVVFQPIVELDGGDIIAAEALVRWEHPERGMLTPAAFLDVAEASGQLSRLGEVVLRAALEEQRQWPALHDGRPRPVTVNLSAAELRDRELPQRIAATLACAGVSPEALILEVTERLIIDDLATAAEVLGELSASGVRIAFDDFGSGHSGLSHLRDLPVDIVKLDRSFVGGLDTERGRVLVSAVLDLSTALGKSVVAEGIERDEELDRLAAMGCGHGQGYLLGRPVPGPDLRARMLAPDDAIRGDTSPDVAAVGR